MASCTFFLFQYFIPFYNALYIAFLLLKILSNTNIIISLVYKSIVAGLHVSRGAGNVNVTHTIISDNYVDGVNITYGGGCQNVSWSEISNNVGAGISLWLNETTVNTPVNQEFVIAYSNISLNHDYGVLVGNFCGPAIVNASGNYFDSGSFIGLQVLSCWRDSTGLAGLENVLAGNTLLQELIYKSLDKDPSLHQ